jgi:hypothetical protein
MLLTYTKSFIIVVVLIRKTSERCYVNIFLTVFIQQVSSYFLPWTKCFVHSGCRLIQVHYYPLTISFPCVLDMYLNIFTRLQEHNIFTLPHTSILSRTIYSSHFPLNYALALQWYEFFNSADRFCLCITQCHNPSIM